MKVQRIGDELGIVLPPEAVERFGLEEGGEFFVAKQNDGVLLSADKKLADVMHAYDQMSAKYRNALRALADN